MVWSVVSKNEMEQSDLSPVFHYYQEVLGKDKIKLAIVEESDSLSFASDNDVILLRTASRDLIETIMSRGLASTAEHHSAYELVRDKRVCNDFLRLNGIRSSRSYVLGELENGKTYFVKPRYGSDSYGVSPECICVTRGAVLKQMQAIERGCNQDAIIEDFIDGDEFTIGCCSVNGNFVFAPIKVNCKVQERIQTRERKTNFQLCCEPVIGYKREKLNSIAKLVLQKLDIRHHARIDIREDADGNLYVIDVNLIPGLSPVGLYARSFLLNYNFAYSDTIEMLVNSSSRF